MSQGWPSSILALALLLGPAIAIAQPSEAPGLGEVGGVSGGTTTGRGMPELITDCAFAAEFGGTDLERAGWCVLGTPGDEQRYVQVRTLADQALRANPRSYRAHYLMGVAQHLGEANLPKSLFHLERAEELMVAELGAEPPPETPEHLLARRVYLELVYVHGEMDHHQEKIDYVDRIYTRLHLDYSPLKAWPLMKLKRWEEARAMARSAILEDLPDGSYWRSVGLTALCAIESEMRNRDAAYEACMAAAEPVMREDHEGGVALSNAAAASIEMFKLDEAERLYVEATRRAVEGTINPWGRLVHLYLRQGRFAEALSALREMHTYRKRRPPYFDQQDQADAELTGASLLMVAGRMEDALRITARTADRPDRQGTSSAAAEQNEAGDLVMDRVARREVARRLEEQASWSTWGEAVKLRLKAAKLRFEAWIHGRRAATLLSSDERLVTSLRPECPGSIELPSWLDGEVIGVVGPGAALAAIEVGRRQETLPESLTKPVFAALEAEARLLKGDDAEALELAEQAVEGVLPSEVLLRARAAAIGAQAARNLGQLERAMAGFERVLTSDPALIRRLGLRLPVELVPASDAPEVRAAVDFLEQSPLFEATDWGFRLVVAEDGVILTLPDGSEVARARAQAGPSGDTERTARRIARAAHEGLLIPNVDVTQADVRSLDGGLGGGGSASERAKSVLDEVLGGEGE